MSSACGVSWRTPSRALTAFDTSRCVCTVTTRSRRVTPCVVEVLDQLVERFGAGAARVAVFEEQQGTPRRIVEQAVEIAQVPQGLQVWSHRSCNSIRAWSSASREIPIDAGRPGPRTTPFNDWGLSCPPGVDAFCVLVPCVVVAAVAAAPSAQQPPPIGIAPVTLTGGPYVFDTAEQHKIRVSVVARGLAHPFSLAFLPDGDALVTERGGRLRVVRNATGAQGGRRDARCGAGGGRAADAGVPDRRPAGSGAASEVRVEPLGVLHLQQGRRSAADAAGAPQVGRSRWPAAPSTARR